MTVVDRPELRTKIQAALRGNPAVALLGPRQCGKTTIAREVATGKQVEYFDLEDPVGAARLAEPMSSLSPLRGLVIIDEVQRQPGLFPVLRVLLDRPRTPARFLLLGSASPDLVRDTSETLAGRIAFVDMSGFTLDEIDESKERRLWLRGGFPRAFLARSEAASVAWREDFIRTFLERDLAALRNRIPATALRRLWIMLAHYHGQLWNASEISRSLGESHTTVKNHLDLLTGAFMVRQLQPWFENLGKRQLRSPKVYIRDTGILHSLLGLGTFAALEGHPKLGASWEGFVLEHAIAVVGERNAFFWATQGGADLDLLLHIGGRRLGVEVKYRDAPRLTKSMAIAASDLKLDRQYVVYPGNQRYMLKGGAEVVPLRAFLDELRRMQRRRYRSVGQKRGSKRGKGSRSR